MKRFLTYCASFLLLLIGVNIVVTAVILKLYYSPYEALTFNTQSIHTLILSDSHGLALEDNLNNAGIGNFSASSESYFDMLRKLRFAIKHCPNLQRIILTADDHTLSSYRESANNKDRSLYFIDDYENDPLINNWYQGLKEKQITKYIGLVNPKGRDVFKAYIKGIFHEKKASKKVNWKENDRKEIESKTRAIKQFPDKASSLRLKDALKQIISLAHSKNIKIIGIKYPLASQYIKDTKGDWVKNLLSP